MAFKHRKLFPSSFISSSDCLIYYCDQTACSPSCSDIYPPIPTPPPPPPRHHAVSPISIALITSLSIFFVFVLYFALIKKDSFRNQGDAVNRRTSRLAQEHQHLDENLTPVYDNPIWLIATVGLPLGVIKSISFFKYKKDDGLIDGTDCSVCLSEFQEDETLRILPKCSHAFHINCIDTWLSTHTNCPLCRAPIVSTDPVSRPATANEETQMRTSDHNGSTVDRTEAEHEAEPAAGIDQGNSGVLKECRNSSGKETNSDVGKGEETLSATGLANSDPGTSECSSGSDKSIRNSWVMK